jgi:hypothetical protein
VRKQNLLYRQYALFDVSEPEFAIRPWHNEFLTIDFFDKVIDSLIPDCSLLNGLATDEKTAWDL